MASAVLSLNHMGQIGTAPLRAPRRWQEKDRGNDFFDQMKLVWPTYGLREENKKYTDNFRMDKQTYEMLHNEVKARQGCNCSCLPRFVSDSSQNCVPPIAGCHQQV